jgi:hypothetical protein
MAPVAAASRAIAFVCITGLGLNADALLTSDTGTGVPLAPRGTTAVIDRLARPIEDALADDRNWQT